MNQEIPYLQKLVKEQSKALVELSLKIDLQEKQLDFFKSCCIRLLTANKFEQRQAVKNRLAEFYKKEDNNNEQVRRPSEAEKPKTITCYNSDCRYYHESFEAVDRSCECDRIYCIFRIPF